VPEQAEAAHTPVQPLAQVPPQALPQVPVQLLPQEPIQDAPSQVLVHLVAQVPAQPALQASSHAEAPQLEPQPPQIAVQPVPQ
jgi:hypothetical protein